MENSQSARPNSMKLHSLFDWIPYCAVFCRWQRPVCIHPHTCCFAAKIRPLWWFDLIVDTMGARRVTVCRADFSISPGLLHVLPRRYQPWSSFVFFDERRPSGRSWGGVVRAFCPIITCDATDPKTIDPAPCHRPLI